MIVYVIDVIYRSMWLKSLCLRLEFYVIHTWLHSSFLLLPLLLFSSHLWSSPPDPNYSYFTNLNLMAAPRRSPLIHSARLYQSSWPIFIRTTRCMTDAPFFFPVRSPTLTAPEASFKQNLFFFSFPSGVPTSRANVIHLSKSTLSSMIPPFTRKEQDETKIMH